MHSIHNRRSKVPKLVLYLRGHQILDSTIPGPEPWLSMLADIFDLQTHNAPLARRLCKILIRVDLFFVQCLTHVAYLRRSYVFCAAKIYT